MPEFQHPPGGYVFIVTYGRSGSTLLQRLVNTLPGYQIRGENNNALVPLFDSWRAIVKSPNIFGMRAQGAPSSSSHPWFGAERIDPDRYSAALVESFVRTVLQPAPGVQVSGFKEIRLLHDPEHFTAYLEFLLQVFPKARLVFNTRNHADVMQSGWWRGQDPERVKGVLTAAEAVFHAVHASHPDRSVLLQYDAYTADHAAFEPLFDLLGAHPGADIIADVMATRLTHAA